MISWVIEDGEVKALSTKKNKVAAITDGETVLKITLFEEFSSKVKQDMSYMMRGHELRGQAPPYLINITARTQFFKAPALAVSEALIIKAEELLNPPSPATPLNMSPTSGGLITVEGEVVEVNICGSIRIDIALGFQRNHYFFVFKSKNNNFIVLVKQTQNCENKINHYYFVNGCRFIINNNNKIIDVVSQESST